MPSIKHKRIKVRSGRLNAESQKNTGLAHLDRKTVPRKHYYRFFVLCLALIKNVTEYITEARGRS